MSYARNRVIEDVLRERSPGGASDGGQYVSDAIEYQDCRQIAAIIADGLHNDDGTDGVDYAEIGRIIAERVVQYVAGCDGVARRIADEEAREAAEQARDRAEDQTWIIRAER